MFMNLLLFSYAEESSSRAQLIASVWLAFEPAFQASLSHAQLSAESWGEWRENEKSECILNFHDWLIVQCGEKG